MKWSSNLFCIPTGHNPIYNLLPDILGKLSIENLKRESFCNIMQFLIGSIKRVFEFFSNFSDKLLFLGTIINEFILKCCLGQTNGSSSREALQ